MGKINENGVVREKTTDEEAEYNNLKTLALKKIEDEKTANEKKEADAKKGNDKLLGLGLTQDEATALTGYKPKESE